MKTLIINYKAYEEGIEHGLEIARAANEISKLTGVRIIIAPPFTLLRELSNVCPTISQGVNDIEPGAFTGHISWYEIKKSGAIGILINHSENRLSLDKIKAAIETCKQSDLSSYVCVNNLKEATTVARLSPDFIAYEPPELIGGDISVSTAKPKVVKEFVDIVLKKSNSRPLIGAGIKTPEDIKSSVELGSEGVLVASGIMKAKDFKSVITEFSNALK